MKKCTLLFLMLSGMASFAQTKSTGTIQLNLKSGAPGNVTANLTLNNTTSKATLTMTGPKDRVFSLQIGKSIDLAMASGQDFVYWDNVKLRDAVFTSTTNFSVANDVVDDWTLIGSPQLDSPSVGLVTVTVERAFDTGDPNDYKFVYADTEIDFAWSRRTLVNTFTQGGHGGGVNAGYAKKVPLSTTLGTPDFTLNATTVAPVPAKDMVTLKTTTSLEKINIYSQTGALIKTQVVNSLGATEVQVKDLATGIYMVELVNPNDNAWKKIIIE
jgi:hypothetical protein